MKPSTQVLQLWPAAASPGAVNTDLLILCFTVLTLVLVVPIFIAITIFAIRYRDGRSANRTTSGARDRMLELSWMLIPFVLTLFFFAWGARAFIGDKTPPANATVIDAIGRQWMWKYQHEGGQAEINDLHVPMGRPILIKMISQDVIHGLYIPALRIQMETLPGRYTQLWFNADRPGVYRILCSEFCGTDHSVMGGFLTVMTDADYADWLARSGTPPEQLSDAGHKLFASYGCAGCHEGAGLARAPSLAGLAGKPVQLADGGTVVADSTYLRDKIMNPNHNKMAGYRQLMPNFAGIISEEEMNRLLAYIDSLPGDAPRPGQQASAAILEEVQ